MRLNLYLRGNIWWLKGSDRGVTIRESTRCRKEQRSQAVRVQGRRERELADPEHYRAHQATVASAIERWLREIRASMNPETVRFYDVKSRHVERLLGRLRLTHVTHERVLGYIEKRKAEGAHSHSIHRELTTLRLVLKSAKRAREFGGDPKDVIPRFQTGYVPRTDWVGPEVIWAAIEHLEPVRGAAVAFCISTACDFSNLPAARREHVRDNEILVNGSKTATRFRRVPRVAVMEPFLAYALKHGGEDVLFGDWGSMARDLRKACRRAGVQEFTARTLRRSAATWMVKAGVPYDIAAKFLGHGSTAMLTKVYGQLAPEDAARLIDQRMTVPGLYRTDTSQADDTDRTDINSPQKT
jgi:integrase